MTETNRATAVDCATEEAPEDEASRLFATESERAWYAFHTRPRCEKKAAGVWQDLSLRHYLPLRLSTPRKRKGQRRYSFEVPLFPGYIFGSCDSSQRLDLMRSGYFVQWIEVVDQKQLLEELSSIYVASRRGAGLTLYPELKRGRKVRVIRGPLVGVQGKISRRKDSFRLVLNVSVLGTAVALQVDMQDVELL